MANSADILSPARNLKKRIESSWDMFEKELARARSAEESQKED